MTDNNSSIEDRGSTLSDKLASLDSDFNTNKGFGFMGMLNAGEEKAREELEEIKEEKSVKDDGPPEWFGPINTSLQQTRTEFQQGLGRLAGELQQLKQAKEPEVNQEFSDLPDEARPIIQKFDSLEKNLGTLALRQEHTRAKEALRDARGKYKEFGYTDEDFNQVWSQHVRNNPNVAANTDWDNYFRTQHESRINPRLSQENEKLKAEIEKLKSNRNTVKDLYAVPRSNRQSTPARSSGDNPDFDEELYQRAKSKLQKGKFIGFNRALLEEQRKMALSA